MRRYFYRGRHRKPSHTKRQAAALAVAGATVAVPLTPGFADAAEPDWGPIIACESGGNPKAKNPSSTASGLFQFINGTWKAYGGLEFAPTARQATVEQQYIVANRAFAREGYSPWNASKSCWAGKVGKHSSDDKPKKKASSKKDKPKATVKTHADRAPDGSGTYVCDEEHLYFEACDPHNLGEIVEYPRYDKVRTISATVDPAPEPAPEPSGGEYEVVRGDTLSHIAVRHHVEGGWTALYERNRAVVGDNPHLIYPGQRLAL